MDWGYIAGYFDGEGTAGAYRNGRDRGVHCSLVWHNTHRASLDAMRAFIGCGTVRQRKKKKDSYRPMYGLHIERRQDMLRVIPELIERCIVKSEVLANLLAIVEGKRDQSPGWGNLSAAGPEEVRRLYWDQGLSQSEIGLKYGVGQSAVRLYMKRHKIATRSLKAAGQIAVENRNPDVEKARREKIAAAKRRHWQDPEYRTRQTAAIKVGKRKQFGHTS